jgi:PAS domain S-box-containing protein
MNVGFFPLVLSPPESSLFFVGNYDLFLVGLSLAIAILASYAALLVAQLISRPDKVNYRFYWICLGGSCMGAGTWAMHFTGMLAFSLPCTTTYDPLLTGLSIIPGVLVSTLAIDRISREHISGRELLSGGILLGTGIGAMHYAGMAAYRMNGMIVYDAKLVFLSVVVAFALATLALWIKFYLANWKGKWPTVAPIVGAVVMGLAVSGMHYTAMAAAYFVRAGEGAVSTTLTPTFLASVVLMITSAIITVTLVGPLLARSAIHVSRPQIRNFALSFLAWTVVAWFASGYYTEIHQRQAYEKEASVSSQQANLVAKHIDETLSLLQGVPVLLARNEIIRGAIRQLNAADQNPLDFEKKKQVWSGNYQLSSLNEYLAFLGKNLHIDVVWVLRENGDCIAASNAGTANNFVGTNYSDRIYFQQAQSGISGHQYAVGKITKTPGVFYSYPVMEGNRFIGAVIVKRDITDFSSWIADVKGFLADANKVIVLAHQPELINKTLPDTSIEALPIAERERQYKQSVFQPLVINRWKDNELPNVVRIGSDPAPVVLALQQLAEHGLTVYVLQPNPDLARMEAERFGLFMLIVMAGGMLIVAAGASILYLNVTRQAKKIAREAADRLESQVKARTTDLLATEYRASRILESTADGLYGVDGTGAIEFINPACCKMFGYTAEQAIGHSAHRLFHHSRPDGSPYPAEQCATSCAWRAGLESHVDDETYWHADGHPIPVTLATHPIIEDGIITGSVTSVVDMRERRAATLAREKALIAAENLARARSEFLANMSHEIRTPMNGILGFAQIGYRNFQDSEKARNAFEKITASGQRLLGIVNEILDFSKIDAGKLKIEAIPISLPDVIDRAKELVADMASAKGLELRLELAPDLPIACISDPTRVGQVLLNLLSNAVTGSITLAALRQGGELVFRVSDTGIGMNEKELGYAFNPFQQADGSTTRNFGGIGLGLAICRRISELMKGSISAESYPGVGSIFEFRIPYAEHIASEPELQSEDGFQIINSDKPLTGISILVAEDDAINQMVLQENLLEYGARVVIVGNGSEAIERVVAEGPKAFDLVLMDIQMPVMDGYEATRRILKVAPSLPIIGQTAHAFGEDHDRCLAVGMVGHISKPIEQKDLTELILQVVGATKGKPSLIEAI